MVEHADAQSSLGKEPVQAVHVHGHAAKRGRKRAEHKNIERCA
jgi:hypothetical protein